MGQVVENYKQKGHLSMDMLETGSNSVNPPSQEQEPSQLDYSQGYEIKITVKPSGFAVDGPLPLPQAAESTEPESEDVEEIPDLPTALKHVIAIAKEHPLDTDLDSHFQAGYEGGK